MPYKINPFTGKFDWYDSGTSVLGDPVTIAHGGTNNTSYNANSIPYFDGTKLNESASLTWSETFKLLTAGEAIMTTPIKVAGGAVLGPELLTDPGFETWTSATELTNWTTTVAAGTPTLDRNAAIKHAGTYSAQCGGDAANPDILGLESNLATGLTPGDIVVISGWGTDNGTGTSNGGAFYLNNTIGAADEIYNFNTVSWETIVAGTAWATLFGNPSFYIIEAVNSAVFTQFTGAITVPANGQLECVAMATPVGGGVFTGYLDDYSMKISTVTPSNTVGLHDFLNNSNILDLEDTDTILNFGVGVDSALSMNGIGEFNTYFDKFKFLKDLEVHSLTATGITNSAMTAGSVLFAGAGGVYSQDSSYFKYNSTTHVLKLGSQADETIYPGALAIFSNTPTTDIENHQIGVVGEGLATFSATPSVATGWGIGGYFKGWTNGTARSAGVVGEGMVTLTGDVGASIGVRGYSTQTHAGGDNIGLYGNAASGANNYALYMFAGNIYSGAAQTWTLPSSTSALNIDSNTFVIDSTNHRVGVGTATPQTPLDVVGTISGGTFGTTQRNRIELSAQSTNPTMDFTMSTGGYLRITQRNVFGTQDIFFQAVQNNAAGYGYLESFGGLGMVLGTGTATPVLIRPNRTTTATFASGGGLGLGVAPTTAFLQVASGSVAAMAHFSGTEASGAGVSLTIKNNDTSVASYALFQMHAGDTTHGGVFFGSRAANFAYGIANGITFRAMAGQDIGFTAAAAFGALTSPTLFIQGSTGNVGIGTGTPAYALDNVGTTNSKLLTAGFFSMGKVGNWTAAADSASPKNIFNLGTDYHGSAIFSENVYILNDALKIAQSHSTISGSVLKIPGNGKPFQGSFVFYTTPVAAVVADAAYAGTMKFLVDAASGFVGVGTFASSPTSPLHVLSSYAGVMANFQSSDVNYGAQFQLDSTPGGGKSYILVAAGHSNPNLTTDSFAIYDVAALKYRFVMTPAGNFGFMTATPTNAISLGNDAAKKIWIENTANTVVGRDLTIAAGSTVTGGTADMDGGSMIYQSGLGKGTGTSSHIWQTGTTLTTGTTLQTMSTKMTLLGNGNVGIGTTTPTSKLDVGVTYRFQVAPDYAGLGDIAANSVLIGSRAADFAFFPSTDAGTVGKKIQFCYYNGATVKSAVEISNTAASALGNLLLMKGGGNVAIGLGATAPTARLHLPAGTTAASSAPLKFTTQTDGLTAVEQGAMELVGNSLQFTQKAKRRGVAMTQSTRVIDCNLNNTTIDTYAQFTADLAGTNLTVSAIAAGNIVIGQQITCSAATGAFFVVSQTSGTANGTGVYVVSKSQTIASTNTWRGALLLVEHGANYPEVGKMEESVLRGTIQQNNTGGGILTITIRYNGAAATVTLATASGNIAAGSQIDIKVFTTYRTIHASTGTIQFNAEARIRTSLTAETVIAGNGVYTGDTTSADNTEISAVWSVANATNLFTINQARVLCIEPNR